MCYECVPWAKLHAWGFTYVDLLNYINPGCYFEDRETRPVAFSSSLYSSVLIMGRAESSEGIPGSLVREHWKGSRL